MMGQQFGAVAIVADAQAVCGVRALGGCSGKEARREPVKIASQEERV
jgi:hypothetical protein